MYCSQCKAENEEDSNFCIQCGSQIATPRKKRYGVNSVKNRYDKDSANNQSNQPANLTGLLQIVFTVLSENTVLTSGIFALLLFVGIANYFDFGKKSLTKPRTKTNVSQNNGAQNHAKSAELCDRIGVLESCNNFILENNARSCLNLSNRFFENCGDYDQLHRYRNTAARRLSEWKIAIESANKMVEAFPFHPDSHFNRAGTNKEMGDYRSAVTDYEQTLALLPGEIQAPFELVTLYQQLGQPCLGISPLEQFSYYHPELSSSSENILKTLYRNPACSDMHGSGKAKIQVMKNGTAINTKVTINSKYTGNFIVDTGASFLVLSKGFAERMQLSYVNWPAIIIQTANGTSEGRHGFIDMVSVQGVEAKHIEVVVEDGLGPIDGLLGLSFLNRFKIEMDSDKGYLQLTNKS